MTAPVPKASVGQYPVAKDGEVPALRTRMSRTYKRDNKYQTVESTTPVNYRTAAGTWQPINTQLVRHADATMANSADEITVSLPATSAGMVQTSEAGASVDTRLIGAASVSASMSGSTATYPGVYPGVDAVYEVRADVVEQTLMLASAAVPASFSSRVTVDTGSSLRAEADGSVSVVGSDGAVQASLPSPVMTDSSGDLDHEISTGAAYSISGTSPNYTVTVTPDHAWLTSPARVFPVALDPSVSYGTASDLGCYITNPGTGTAPSDLSLCAGNTGTDNPLAYGDTAYVRRALITFGDLTGAGSAIPTDAVVSSAALRLTVSTASSYTAALDTDIRRPRTAWDKTILWGSQPATSTASTDRMTYTPTAGGSVVFNPTGLTQSFITGANPNYGYEIRLDTETPTNTVQFYGLANTAHHPILTVDWAPVLGQQSFVGAYDHTLSDRSDLHVDLADRNLVINGTDESLTGPGQSLVMRRTYNSVAAAAGTTGAFGVGWLMNGGVDTGLTVARGQINITRAGGSLGAFTRISTVSDVADPGGWNSAPGWKADLTEPDSTHYKLTFRQSHVVETFTLPTSASPTGWLSSVDDGNSNVISYTSTGSPLTTTAITDTTGQRSLSLAYTGGVVTSMVEHLATGATGARTYAYTYSAGNLATYTDPAGKTTRYCYTGNLLTKIITAHGSASGSVCSTTAGTDVTDIAYDATGHVTSITYENGASPITSLFAACTAPTAGFATTNEGTTTFTDPNNNVTTYSFDNLDRIRDTLTPDQHHAKADFTTNNDVNNSVSLSNSGTGNGPGGNDSATTTHFTGDNADSVVDPSGTTVSASYGGSEADQPDHVSDDRDQSTGNLSSSDPMTSNLGYNADGQESSNGKGTTTVLTRHQGDTGVANCGPSGAAAFTGAVCETRDADYNSANPARHRTLYSYNALGQLATMTPAQPDNSRTTPPASTYTYDSHSRLTSVTDARGKTTSYTYDALDRLTQTMYNAGDYTNYSYDEDGDKLATQDYTSTGAKSYGFGDAWTYDALNRMTVEQLDSGSIARQTWDQDSRLATFVDASGTIGYTYNDDGALIKMTQPGGDCSTATWDSPGPASNMCITFKVDNAGRRQKVVYPGGLSVQNYGYDTAGKINAISSVGHTSGTATALSNLTFTYTVAGVATNHITSRTDTATTSRVDYVYTNEGRLFTAKQYNTTNPTGGTLTASWLYCYDANGNRTYSTRTTTVTTCPTTGLTAYDGANQQLGTGTTYDLSGDETAMPTSLPASGIARASTWTDSQQLATTTLNAGTSLASNYFGAGNQNLINTGINATDKDVIRDEPLGTSRVTRQSNGAETGHTDVERDPSGTILAFHDNGTGNYYYPMSDNLGSITRLVDSTGATVDSYSYDPFGVRTTATNGYPQPFGYTGAYTNPTTGLVHLAARYYDATEGRFTQPDPQGHPGDTTQSSPYPYAGNDPIDNVDPNGLDFGDFTSFLSRAGSAFTGSISGYAIGSIAGAGIGCAVGAVLGAGVGCAAGAAVGWEFGGPLGIEVGGALGAAGAGVQIN